MGRWASADVRAQRERQIIKLYKSGYSIRAIAGNVGEQTGSVCYVLKKYAAETGYVPRYTCHASR